MSLLSNFHPINRGYSHSPGTSNISWNGVCVCHWLVLLGSYISLHFVHYFWLSWICQINIGNLSQNFSFVHDRKKHFWFFVTVYKFFCIPEQMIQHNYLQFEHLVWTSLWSKQIVSSRLKACEHCFISRVVTCRTFNLLVEIRRSHDYKTWLWIFLRRIELEENKAATICEHRGVCSDKHHLLFLTGVRVCSLKSEWVRCKRVQRIAAAYKAAFRVIFRGRALGVRFIKTCSQRGRRFFLCLFGFLCLQWGK